MDLSYLDDPTASLAESLTPNAEVVPDESGFYERIVFTPEERARFKAYLKMQIEKTVKDYDEGGIWTKRERNKRAYEGLTDKGEAITLPMTRAMTNQQHAWLVNTVFSKEPIITSKPLGDSKFDIVVKDPDLGVMTPKKVSGTDYCKALESLFEFKWKVRLPMRKVLRDWSMEALQDGTCPALVKIIHEDTSYTVTQRAAPRDLDPLKDAPEILAKANFKSDQQKLQIINSPEFRTVHGDETVQIINVPGEDFLMPIGQIDLQRSPWIAMKTNPCTTEIRQRIAGGKYDFCLPAGEEPDRAIVETVLMSTEDQTDHGSNKPKRAAQAIDKRRQIDPVKEHRVWEVCVRWPILQESDPTTAVITELVCEYHEKSQEVLCCWKLNSWNGKRQYVDYFMRQRPNSYSGTCTVEDVAPFQRYTSHLFHLQVQNMVMRNVSVFFVRKGSSTATFLKNRKLRPGMVVEFDEKDDVDSKPLGTPIESISSEIAFLKSNAQEMALVTQYDTAQANLSRVTSGAFQQQQDLAKMQPEMVYQIFCEAISRLALMYIQALVQYAPEQRLPHFDAETDAVIDNVLYFPRQMITDEFAFTVTATAREDSKDAEFQRDLMLHEKMAAATDRALNILGQIMKPGVPPPFVELGIMYMSRDERMLKNLFNNTRYDASSFVIDPDVIRKALATLLQMAPPEPPPQQGEMNGQQAAASGGVPNAGSGGPVPASGGGQPGPAPVPPQPGIPGIAA